MLDSDPHYINADPQPWFCCRSYPGEKRRKQTQATLTYLLEEADINDDLRIINKTLAQAKQPASPATQSAGKHRSVVSPHGFVVPGTRSVADPDP
jgi:hypothetical protein